MAIDENRLAALQAEHGRIKHVVYNGTDLVFRKPKRVEVQQHAAKCEDGSVTKATADEQLAQQLIVVCGESKDVPGARAAFLEMLEEWPYLTKSTAVGSALSKLTGVVQDDAVKEYGSASMPNGSPQIALAKGSRAG